MKTFFATFVMLLLVASPAQADLTITVSDNGTGGMTMDLFGIGFAGNGVDLISYGTPGDTFLPDNFGFDQGSSTPNFSLNGIFGEGATAVGIQDREGTFGLNSVFQLNFASAIPMSSSLSDLNGTYDVDIDFAAFNLGTYALISEAGSPAFITDVGIVTLNVVPEPACGVFIACVSLGGLVVRRRRIGP